MAATYRLKIAVCDLVREFDDGRKTFQLEDGRIVYADWFQDRSEGGDSPIFVSVISESKDREHITVCKHDRSQFVK